MRSSLLFEHSIWFFLLCVLAGAGYTFFLYYNYKAPWSTRTNKILAGLRLTLVTLLAGLLIGPFLRLIQNEFEEPVIIFGIDNSGSLSLVHDSVQLQGYYQRLRSVARSLEEQEFKTHFRSLSGDLDMNMKDVTFNEKRTDINGFLKGIQNDFGGYNIGAVILLSDGIYNSGISPTFSKFTFPVYTVGAGDTISKKDLVVKNVLFNRISYQGNQFPLIVEVFNEGFVGESARLSVVKNGKVVGSKLVEFTTNNQLIRSRFLLEADEVGIQRYTITLEAKGDEFTAANNSRFAFIDVISGKEKILIAGSSPHPDLKALVSAFESNKNYEFDLFIPGIHTPPPDTTTYDLIIYHQIPKIRTRERDVDWNQYERGETPLLFVVGKQTDIRALNQQIVPLRVNAFRNEGDLVSAVFNTNFTNFNLSAELKEFIPQFPPIRVPFGQIDMDISTQVLLYQRVGSIESDRPLLLLSDDASRKIGLMMGEGMWMWKMNEYAKNKTSTYFNELVLKTVQFLTSKDDRRKFRVYPRINEFVENEPVILETEIYNSLYELIFDIKVDLELKDQNGDLHRYSYVNSEQTSNFTIRDLEPGIYDFVANAMVNEEPKSASGQFLVQSTDIESLNLTADHHLLRTLAGKNGGRFYLPNDLQELEDTLINERPPKIIHSTESFLPLINMEWAFALLLLLISAEWFIRKYQGSY